MGKQDACTDPTCYQAKVDAHVAKSIASKPKLVQISTGYGQQQEGSTTLPRNKYTEIRPEKPTTKEEATRPEFKTCKYTTEAIISDGIDKGEIRKVCTEANCSVHHPRKRPQQIADDSKWKAEQEKQRKEQAIANTTGIRILAAITAAVPVRLMKRDLLFVVERLASLLDENHLAVIARQHGIKKAKDSDSIEKLFTAYLRRAEESALGGLLVGITILHTVMRQNSAQVLRDAATAYKVDVDAIRQKVKEEFAAKEKGKAEKKATAKTVPQKARKSA
jgi:ParB family chromosome partitioning protein